MQLLKHVYTNYKAPLSTKEAATVPPAPRPRLLRNRNGSRRSAMPFSFLFRKGRVKKTFWNSASSEIILGSHKSHSSTQSRQDTPGLRGQWRLGRCCIQCHCLTKLGANVLLIELSHQCGTNEKLQWSLKWSWVEAGTPEHTAGKCYPTITVPKNTTIWIHKQKCFSLWIFFLQQRECRFIKEKERIPIRRGAPKGGTSLVV